MQWTQLSRDEMAVPGDPKRLGVTPYFRYESLLNEPQSQIQGKPVHDLKEVVELRFAANSNYKPVFGVDEMAEMDDNGRVITWAERYKAQYQAFLAGSEQEAEGTPLEELLPYGISQAQLSLCRALNIYSIEALAHVTGPGVKRLGVHGNELIPMAQRYMDARSDGSQVQSELAELRRKVAELQAPSRRDMGEEPFLSTLVPEASNPFETVELADAQVKDEIERLTGARPRGNPSRATLDGLLAQARDAQDA